ncbi:MAG: transcription-repair coupling factor [Clostridia bacterium]|nr:transcription-repair coupling factor [Clostridia bacterium]
MRFLRDVLFGTEEYRTLERAVGSGRTPAMATGLSGIHKAHLIHTMCARLKRRALVLAADEAEAARLCADLNEMGTKAMYYPARDFTFREVTGVSGEFIHQRIGALFAFSEGKCDVVIACADAALQYTVPPEILKNNTAVLREGAEISPEKLIALLFACGYVRAEQVEGSGQFSARGGIVDLFMPSASRPYRIEFWGDEIDTISEFDVETQRRTDRVDSFTITPSSEILFDDKEELARKIEKKASSLRDKNAPKAKAVMSGEAEKIRTDGRLTSLDKYYSLVYEKPSTLFDYFVENELVFVSEQPNLKDRVRSVLYQWSEDLADYMSEGILCRGLDRFMGEWQDHLSALSERDTIFIDNFARGSCELPLRELVNFTAKQLSLWGGSVSVLCEDLESLSASDKTCIILAGTEKNAENVYSVLLARGISAGYILPDSELEGEGIYVAPGSLSASFEYPSAGFCLIAHSHVSGAAVKKKTKRRKKNNALFSLAELSPGDYVVHSAHGIGQFAGVEKKEIHGVVKDYIIINYAKGDTLFVPVTQLDMIAKYIGPKEDSTVKLSRLGGNEWKKAKSRVRSAVKDIADQLIRMYSERMKAKGFAFSGDNEWQRDFENKFEYEETDDQKRCIAEIKADMERPVPMDRLLCGDVGFGKTEVALRAAFKCVTDGKQCALLVPTTILAWQHYQTVIRRFEGYPITIELLSRFRTPRQQEQIIEKLKRGDIDMVIGTHRLIQKDIRFRDIGLFIVDEEQRFGVEQKENFKAVYKDVDILTLSATPIPRTLNMAMSGIRDMSTLEEAPQDRHPVQSYVLEYDDAVINEAIRRELRRGGQVFYLYNRVSGIESKASEISHAIPEAKVGFGHGKMTEAQLSEVWRQMLEQEINVLVCTTIIETGVDIPNANTLIIENADRMGLSQLHQLRGRVGRSTRRAYAYFTFQRDKAISEISQKRLEAIREFTEFGSGFKIAMRDLEIRGAGNMLGAMQHGHMTDVGYDMYMKLLGEAVSAAKGEKPKPEDRDCVVDIQADAHIPENYISNLNHRLEMYRRIADIRTNDDAGDVIDEMTDRFGDIPKAVEGLINIALVRSKAQTIGVNAIRQRDDTLYIYFDEIRCQGAANIIVKMKGRAKLNMTVKPNISVKLKIGEPAGAALETIFDTGIRK